jgi:hypothetical protein
MFRPDFFGGLVGLENYYLMYLAGMALWGIIFAMQKLRTGGPATPITQS